MKSKIENFEELAKAIIKVLPNVDLEIVGGKMEGRIKNNLFTITSTSDKGYELIVDESGAYIIEILGNVLKGTSSRNEPVLSYDKVTPVGKREHYAIWSTLNPKKVLYNAIILCKVVPFSKLQNKIINVRLYNPETKTMDYITEEELDCLYRPVSITGTIKHAIDEIDLNNEIEKVKGLSKKVANHATIAVDAVIEGLGGKEKVDAAIESGKEMAKEVFTTGKEKAKDLYEKAKSKAEEFMQEFDEEMADAREDADLDSDDPSEDKKPEADDVIVQSIYPESMKPIVDIIDTLDEPTVFFLIKDAMKARIKYQEILINGEKSEEALLNFKEAIYKEEYLIHHTGKFGIEFSEFISWYKYYENFYNGLFEEQKKELELKRSLGFGIPYKPELTWKQAQEIARLMRQPRN